jgi:CelD/BcsL family acetyltransferase involved in cellulose biosynthesis
MKTVIYTAIDTKVIKEWDALWEKSASANYTNSAKWFLSVTETFRLRDLAIIALYNKSTLVAVGGLVKEKKFGLPFYTSAPSDFVCGLPFLIDMQDQKLVDEFIKQLLLLGNVFLSNIPEEFVITFKESTNDIDATYQSSNYYLPVKKDEKGNAFLNKRKKLLHQIKDMQSDFTFQSFDGSGPSGLDTAFALDEQSSKHGKGYNVFNSIAMQEFYRTLAKNFTTHFLVNIVYFQKKPIAYEIGFLIGKNYFGSQLAYDMQYRQYSPGKVILVKLADYLASVNVRVWDMGSGESAIKQLVTEEKRQLYQIVLSKNTRFRRYFITAGRLKNYAFEQSHRHAKLYSVYKKITSKSK